MILEQVNVSARQISLIVDLLVIHVPQVLVWLLVLIVNQALRELVHKVCGHPHDFCIVHSFFHS